MVLAPIVAVGLLYRTWLNFGFSSLLVDLGDSSQVWKSISRFLGVPELIISGAIVS